MLIFITGGAASGKSAYAERLLCQHAQENSRLYLATMQPFGVQAQARVKRHHALRAGKGFDTIERYTALNTILLPRTYQGILLECLSNLLANEMFAEDGAGQQAEDAILCGIAHLQQQCEVLVVVSSEIFSDGYHYSCQTEQYRQILARLHCKLATWAQVVIHTVCGLPVPLKGESYL